MTFETSAQAACYEQVKQWLEQVRYLVETDREEPIFRARAGSSRVTVQIHPWGDDEALIRIRAQVVANVEMDLELATFLLHENSSLVVGGFGLDEADNVVFEHSLVGGSCDLDELVSALAAVSLVADRYDNRIVKRWGGQRAVDLED